MAQPKRFVYILKSINAAATYYVGVTSCMAERLAAHNAGLSPHTAEHRPWRTLVVIEFDAEEPALKFERYLKTGSGREFGRGIFDRSSLDLRGMRLESLWETSGSRSVFSSVRRQSL